jgi:hypothetical protein
MKPFSPDEALRSKTDFIPDFVIEAFNGLLAKKYNGGSVEIKQDDAIAEIIKLSPTAIERHNIFDNNWLDIESIYEDAGWSVSYDKPAYNESYSAYFEFSKGKK